MKNPNNKIVIGNYKTLFAYQQITKLLQPLKNREKILNQPLVMKIWCLSYCQAIKVHASLHKCAVSHEPVLHA